MLDVKTDGVMVRYRSVWHIGDGPAIRLVPHTREGLVRLVWNVTLLVRARAFLGEQNMLGAWIKQQVPVDPASLFELDIHLVE